MAHRHESEKYEPIATIATMDAWKDNLGPMPACMGGQAIPYDYGYLIVMMPGGDGDSLGSIVKKYYAMGRFSHENGVVMPDQRTVYQATMAPTWFP